MFTCLSSLRKLRLSVLAILLWSSASSQSLRAAEAADEGVAKLLSVPKELEPLMANALEGFRPRGKASHGEMNAKGVYILSGDLFDNGQIYAIVDTSPIAICRWTGDKWKVVALIDETTAWKFPGWEDERPGGQPVSDKPFWILHLQHRPLLVIAADVEKRGQNFQIILLDRKFHRAADTAYSYSSFQDSPVVKSGHLITQESSRGKAEWGEYSYWRVIRGKFVEEARWRSYTPFNHPEEGETYYAQKAGRFYRAKKRETDDRTWEVSRTSKDEQTFFWGATVRFPLSKRDDGGYTESLAYLFSRLTRLPPTLFPSLAPDVRLPAKLQLAPKVKGNSEAIRLLSPPSAK